MSRLYVRLSPSRAANHCASAESTPAPKYNIPKDSFLPDWHPRGRTSERITSHPTSSSPPGSATPQPLNTTFDWRTQLDCNATPFRASSPTPTPTTASRSAQRKGHGTKASSSEQVGGMRDSDVSGTKVSAMVWAGKYAQVRTGLRVESSLSFPL